MEITTIFLAVLSLMYLAVSLHVSRIRNQLGVRHGVGDSPKLLHAVRAHGNFSEYVPILIFILWMMEYNLASGWLLWVFGLIVVVGRVAYTYGMLSAAHPLWARGVGMLCTYVPLLIGSVVLIYVALT